MYTWLGNTIKSVLLTLGLGSLALAQYAGPKVTITYWHGFTGPDLPVMEALVKKFNETHPNIEVKAQAIPWGNLFQQLEPAVAAGRAPEVAVLNEDVITRFIARGVVQELTPEMLRSVGLDKNRFYKSLWEVADYKGRSYGVPIHSVTLVMYYNKDLFAKAGFDPNKPPRTRGEFLEATRRLTVDRNGKYPGEAGFDPNGLQQWAVGIPTPWMGGTIAFSVALQNGIQWVDSTQTKATFNSVAGVETFQFLVDLVKRYQISPANATEQSEINAFRAGKAAMNFNGVWMLSQYRGQQGLNFGIAPFPQLGTRCYAVWGGSSHMVLPVQRNLDRNKQLAALTFINWMTSPEQNLTWTTAGGLPT